jgi:hypothetical protein
MRGFDEGELPGEPTTGSRLRLDESERVEKELC